MPKFAWGVTFEPPKVTSYNTARRLILAHVNYIVTQRIAARAQQVASAPPSDAPLDAVDLLLSASDEYRNKTVAPDDPTLFEIGSNKVRGVERDSLRA